MPDLPRTVIEFVDPVGGENPVCHKLKEVHINGTAVLVAEDGIDIEYGAGIPTAVTLRMLPTEVHFINKQPSKEK